MEIVAAPPAEAQRPVIGCLSLLAAPFIGLVLGLAQIKLLFSTWIHCANLPWGEVDIAVRRGDDGIFGLLGRIPVYGFAFLVGLFAASAVTKSASRGRRVALAWAAGLLCCVIVFAVDFTIYNGLLPGYYRPNICPGGHPAWWPF